MAKKKSSGAKAIVSVLLLAIVIVSSFVMLSKRTKTAETTVKVLTPVEEVMARNLDTNYPVTPKEVLKYYSEITRCFYSEEYTEEQLVQMAKMSRQLLDDELYMQQNDEEYLDDLKLDIDMFHSGGSVISSYTVSSAADVDYYHYEGRDWAVLNCAYSVRGNGKFNVTNEEFLLRKSEDGHWKIFGWRLAEETPEGNEK